MNFKYNFNGQNGNITVNFGFPDYASKLDKAEFELHISTMQSKKTLDTKERKILKSKLLSEMDKQKSLIYNDFFGISDRLP